MTFRDALALHRGLRPLARCYHRRVIVDFHTHIFPPQVIEQREHYVREDPTFALLYADPKAKLATAEDLLRSMDAASIDVSIALGFQWTSEATCRLHNEYLIEAAEKSGGRIVPFCILPLASSPGTIDIAVRHYVSVGVRGFGELRPENAGFVLESELALDALGHASRERSILMFHVSEPVGHAYTGKEGLNVGAFHKFVGSLQLRPMMRRRGEYVQSPLPAVIGAHWGGGLPFYASMPEVRRLFEGNVYVDTAASSLLYDDGVYERVVELIGAERILFGSDYPLLSQKRSRERIEASGLDDAAKALILGDNAMRLLKCWQ